MSLLRCLPWLKAERALAMCCEAFLINLDAFCVWPLVVGLDVMFRYWFAFFYCFLLISVNLCWLEFMLAAPLTIYIIGMFFAWLCTLLMDPS